MPHLDVHPFHYTKRLLQAVLAFAALCCIVPVVFAAGLAAPAYAGPTADVAAVNTVQPYAQGVGIVDDLGRRVELPAPARRIVALYAGLQEMLEFIGAGAYIVACTDASPVDGLPSVGTHMRPNLEMVAALQPDLVVQMEGRQEAAQTALALERMGITVARFSVHDFPSLFFCMQRLAALTGLGDAGLQRIEFLQKRLDAAQKATSQLAVRPKVFFETRYPNLIGAGGKNMASAVIQAAGGDNVLQDYSDRLVRLSEETLLILNPDIYLIQEGSMNKAPVPLTQRSHFSALAAVQKHSWHVVDESAYSRPGPDNIVAVEQLAAAVLHWAKQGALNKNWGEKF